VGGNFGEINKGFKQFIAETAILAGSQSDTGNMTPANWTDVGKKDAVKLIKSDSRWFWDVQLFDCNMTAHSKSSIHQMYEKWSSCCCLCRTSSWVLP